jgi:hypothetical protein
VDGVAISERKLQWLPTPVRIRRGARAVRARSRRNPRRRWRARETSSRRSCAPAGRRRRGVSVSHSSRRGRRPLSKDSARRRRAVVDAAIARLRTLAATTPEGPHSPGSYGLTALLDFGLDFRPRVAEPAVPGVSRRRVPGARRHSVIRTTSTSPTRRIPPSSRSCSRAAHGPGRSNCSRGWSGFDAAAEPRGHPPGWLSHDTLVFQSANVPLGLCSHAQTCNS